MSTTPTTAISVLAHSIPLRFQTGKLLKSQHVLPRIATRMFEKVRESSREAHGYATCLKREPQWEGKVGGKSGRGTLGAAGFGNLKRIKPVAGTLRPPYGFLESLRRLDGCEMTNDDMAAHAVSRVPPHVIDDSST